VIGVIVIVSVTVIAAAVIGGFVSQMDDQRENAPDTSFDSNQTTKLYWGTNKANLTTINISHTGGEVVDVAQTDIVIEGNSSAWGLQKARTSADPQNWDYVRPQPDVRKTLGTNEPAEFTAGETWSVYGYEGLADEHVEDENYFGAYFDGDRDGEGEMQIKSGVYKITQDLDGRESVNVVWRAESGEETQLLYRYVVGVGPETFSRATSTPRTASTPDTSTTSGNASDSQRETSQEVTSASSRSSGPISLLPALGLGLLFGSAVTLGILRYRRDSAIEEESTRNRPDDHRQAFRSRAGGQVPTAPRDGRPPDRIPTAPKRDLTYREFDRKRPIGKGGNADVYRATATELAEELTVALKEPRFEGTLHTDTVDRFTREAETWERLDDHDHIVGVIDWETEPLPWIAMEYMDAGDLSEQSGDLTFPQAVWTAGRIAEGVRHAHDHGVIHLDLKPSNILLRETGEGYWDVPKIGDWGLAKLLLEHSKSVEELSPSYAAPEQFDPEAFGGTDKRTDIYQLGSIFYELFVGEPAFEGAAASVLRRKLDGEVTPPSVANTALPAALDDVLLTAMAVEKANRYDSVLAFRNELRDLLDQL
jgi:FlaG/FlaF family flagellin (archaellin)/tRNA A-37 threonylcarbamoyl transferase component Bud32